MGRIGLGAVGVSLVGGAAILGVRGRNKDEGPLQEAYDNGVTRQLFGTKKSLETQDPTPNEGTQLKRRGETLSGLEGVVELQNSQEQSSGTGWVVAPGIVVTNYHFANSRVEDAEVYDRHRNRYKGEVIAKDKENDLALLRVENLRDQPFAMDDVVTSGEAAELHAYPWGFYLAEPAAAEAKSKVLRGTTVADSLTFASKSAPGSSGGPVLNSHDEVLGTLYSGRGDVYDPHTSDTWFVPNDKVIALMEQAGISRPHIDTLNGAQLIREEVHGY